MPGIPARIERRSSVAKPAADGQVVASVVHEINNPLDALLNLLYLLEGEATFTEKGRQYLNLAEEEVRRVSQIAHQALDGFRDSANPRVANVPDLVSSVIDLYRSRFESHGIALETRYCRDGNFPVHSCALRQVFSNLLLNAAHAMHEGGRLQVRVCRAREWSGQKRHGLRVTVADNGCGIPEGDLVRLLEPFFTTKGAGGSGLGLSLVHDVVKRHGGSLRIRSSTKRERSGSIFAIFLPES